MNTQIDPNLPLEPMRYHATGRGGLFRPIPFGFVTATMCAEMLDERRRILTIVPRSRLAEQIILLERYDPQHRADQFRALLRPFLTVADLQAA